ncbi:hypothetical protein LWI28_008367 [Acer negundo]|uniref:Glycosyltransferase n=1 Tax=Acer negundo TaxID=4023 RepID=A0AAD5IDT5_ACENE|nr:hypothetical protein LWI28_008367 [Acer negundo]
MKKAELVFIPAPGFSHLVSTFEFAKRLCDRDRRFSVTFLIMNSLLDPPAVSFIESQQQKQQIIKLINLPQPQPPPRHLKPYPEIYKFTHRENYKPLVKHLLSNMMLSTRSAYNSAPQIAGLVLDFFTAPMVDVGHELGLPSYLFSTSNLALLDLTIYFLTHPTHVKESDPELTLPSFVNSVPTSVLPAPVFSKEDGFVVTLKLAQKFMDMKGIIVNTFQELESYALLSFLDTKTPPVYPVGPVLGLSSSTEMVDSAQNEKIMKWLDHQPDSSVVFLCFGSMVKFGATQLREIGLGLESSGYRFLWAMGGDSINHHKDILQEGFLDRTAEKGMICRWAPQMEVLAHKAIGGFVSHCGWNSILESLWCGVPIVTWPIHAEQKLNAFKMVRELGLAVEMKSSEVNVDDLVMMADEIKEAISRVMDSDSEVRKRVQEMAENSKKAVMDGGSSHAYFARLIEDIIANI